MQGDGVPDELHAVFIPAFAALLPHMIAGCIRAIDFESLVLGDETGVESPGLVISTITSPYVPKRTTRLLR
jgi:hypothetical protein